MSCSTICILLRKSTPIPTRFTSEELTLIDSLVENGVGDSRSAVIRRGVQLLADSVNRALVGSDPLSQLSSTISPTLAR